MICTHLNYFKIYLFIIFTEILYLLFIYYKLILYYILKLHIIYNYFNLKNLI